MILQALTAILRLMRYRGKPPHPPVPPSHPRKRLYRCSLCGEPGHNIKTCPERGKYEDVLKGAA